MKNITSNLKINKRILILTTVAVTTFGIASAQNGQKYSSSGNALSSGDVLGSTNNQPVIFISNDEEVFRISPNGSAVFKNDIKLKGGLQITDYAGSGFRLLKVEDDGTLSVLSSNNTQSEVLTGAGIFTPFATMFQKEWDNKFSGTSNSFLAQDGHFYNFDYINGTNWSVKGNKGLDANQQFIGTIDPVDLVMRTNNKERLRILSTGELQIAAPDNTNTFALDVAGNAHIGGWLYVDNGVVISQKIEGDEIKTRNLELLATSEILGKAHFVNDAEIMERVSIGDNLFNIDPKYRLSINGATEVKGDLNTNNIYATNVSSQTLNTTNVSAGGNLTVGGTANISGLQTTSSEQSLLSIDESGNITKTSYTLSEAKLAGYWSIYGNGGTDPSQNYIGTNDENDFVLRTNLQERVRISSIGNVGIGTSTTSDKLEVVGHGKFSFENNYVEIYHGGTNGRIESSGNLLLNAEGNGDVVVGKAWATGNLIANNNLTVSGTSNLNDINAAGISTLNNLKVNGYLEIPSQSNNNNQVLKYGANGKAVWGTVKESQWLPLTDGINYNGKVGINTTKNLGALSINNAIGKENGITVSGGNVTTSIYNLGGTSYEGAIQVKNGDWEDLPTMGYQAHSLALQPEGGNVRIGMHDEVSGNESNLFVDGKIAIGTNTPHFDNKLEVVNSIGLWSGSANYSARGQLEQNGIAMYIGENIYYDDSWQKFQNDLGTSQIRMYNTNEGIQFYTGSATENAEGLARMVVTQSGNVGIGTTTPAADLHISGNGDQYLQIDAQGDGFSSSTRLVSVTSANRVESQLQFNSLFNFVSPLSGTGVLTIKDDGTTSIYASKADYYGLTVNNTADDGYGLKIKSGCNSCNDKNAISVENNNDVVNFKVSQKGIVHAREVIINNDTWGDYVFEHDYSLMGLRELENYFTINHHLPEIPSAEEIKESGIPIGEMQKLQMVKIEEIILYLVQLKKENESMRAEINNLKKK